MRCPQFPGAVKSPDVVCDGYRLIFMSGQALSAGMVTSPVLVELVPGTSGMRQPGEDVEVEYPRPSVHSFRCSASTAPTRGAVEGFRRTRGGRLHVVARSFTSPSHTSLVKATGS